MPSDETPDRARAIEIYLDGSLCASSDTRWVLDPNFEAFLLIQARPFARELRERASRSQMDFDNSTLKLVRDGLAELGSDFWSPS